MRTKYSYRIPSDIIQRFMQTLDELLNIENKDDLAGYLITLDSHAAVSPSLAEPISGTTKGSEISRVSSGSTKASRRFPTNGKSLYDRIHRYKNGDAADVDESQIVRSLMFTLTGSTSDMFVFEGDNIKIPTGLSFGEVGLLYQILEPCLIFKKLSEIVAGGGRRSRASGKQKVSQTEVAFFSVIQEELLKYTQYVNSIVNSQNLEENSQSLTLRKLHLLLSDWISKLRFFNYLQLVYQDMESNEFLSLLDQLRGQGDPVLGKLSEEFFEYCIRPFIELVEDWTFSGELSDSDSEEESFFVRRREDQYGESFAYQVGKVPSCVTQGQSYAIFQIGKCLNFLKNDCNEIKWCEYFKQKYGSTKLVNDISKWNFDGPYQEIVHYCYSDVLCKKYDLVGELSNLHSFLLMGQGDFINSVVLKGNEVLNQSSSSLSAHQLIQILHNSIESTSVKDNYSRDIVNRLDARVLQLDSYGTIGWEVFTLDYELRFPLNKLFEADHKEYLRMFNFMFKLVRVNLLLNQGWASANHLKRRSIGKIARRGNLVRKSKEDLSMVDMRCLWIMKTFKRLNILRNEFVKFMNVLIGYIDLEIVDANYQKFAYELRNGKSDFGAIVQGGKGGNRSHLKSMKMDPIGSKWSDRKDVRSVKEYNLEELIQLHQNYIRAISRCKILDNENPKSRGKHSKRFYIQQIYSFLEIINKFVELNNEFNNLLVEMLSITGISAGSDINQDRYDDYLNRIDTKFNRLMENLTNEIINKFEDNLEEFTTDLMADKDENLRCMGLMLSN
ncbi:DEKNAAC101357 [Brettanomyces naardenensis]|uniref:Spindle pole body component n=1 Tax=Brettanomyces naardenensis TaxID=13370 RepID=A0A448YHR0_BRENA|nr:DEKNAAC101357 [Brettanomyces naardenensis]